VRAFLPYKRYQLLDAGWIVCCAAFRTPTLGRMRGPDEREYSYSIETLNPTDDGKLTVRFLMRDGDDLEQPFATRGGLLDSIFSIAIGETVVIGTSRLKGDQALIALLTAAGKPGAAR
jgi:hypothetical protein